MPDTNWIQVVAALLGGGAVGAIITAVVTTYRARRQPVGRRVDVEPVFLPAGSSSPLKAKIAITHEGKAVTFENLYLAEIQLVNRGNRDLDEFGFGATLGEGDRCIYVDAPPPDRYHQVTQVTRPTPDAPQRDVDFKVRPFNRGDSYLLKLYVVVPAGKEAPGPITLGSSTPVRFVEMPTMGEILGRLSAEVAAVNVGPLRIGLRR